MDIKFHFILFLLALLLLSLVFTAGATTFKYATNQMASLTDAPIAQEAKQQKVESVNNQPRTAEQNLNRQNISLPPQVRHKVPFSSQAPLGDWSEPYQNASEETSLIMAHTWLKGKGDLGANEVDRHINNIIQKEQADFGFYKDTSAFHTSLLLANYFQHYNYQLLNNVNLKDIKEELADGNLIIAPVTGGVLDNPNYSTDARFYHTLVVTGYNNQESMVYTNDPGIRHGYNATYDYATFEKALSDWNYQTQSPEQSGNTVISISRN